MAKHRSTRAADDEAPDAAPEGQVEGSPATAPRPEDARPYEGGPAKRHPDTGEPQAVDDPPGDPARQPQPGDAVPGAPPDPAADESARLRAENDVLRGVVKNLGGNPEEIGKQVRERMAAAGAARGAEGAVRKKVSVPNSNLPALTVSFDPPEGADERATRDAAVAAYRQQLGVWGLPSEPVVGDPDEGETEARSVKTGEGE